MHELMILLGLLGFLIRVLGTLDTQMIDVDWLISSLRGQGTAWIQIYNCDLRRLFRTWGLTGRQTTSISPWRLMIELWMLLELQVNDRPGWWLVETLSTTAPVSTRFVQWILHRHKICGWLLELWLARIINEACARGWLLLETGFGYTSSSPHIVLAGRARLLDYLVGCLVIKKLSSAITRCSKGT